MIFHTQLCRNGSCKGSSVNGCWGIGGVAAPMSICLKRSTRDVKVVGSEKCILNQIAFLHPGVELVPGQHHCSLLSILNVCKEAPDLNAPQGAENAHTLYVGKPRIR